MPILRRVISGVQEEFADAVAYGGGIYAVGYCFGAKYVLLLGAGSDKESSADHNATGSEETQNTTGPTIKAGAMAHGQPVPSFRTGISPNTIAGTMITREDLQGVKVPISLVCVGKDQHTE